MTRSVKIRLAVVLTSAWLLIGVVGPILLCLGLQQPQVIWVVLLTVHAIMAFAVGFAWLVVKLIIWATEGA